MGSLYLLVATPPGLHPGPDAPPPLPRHLAMLLARGHATGEASGSCLSESLARLFGVPDTALAPIALAAEGVDPGDAYWLRADPVHLGVGLHHVVLQDSRHFPIGAEEADDLVRHLNAHFGAELQFMAPHPQRWYARPGRRLALATRPVDRVDGRILEPGLAMGADAGILQRLATEVQMLLHDHPVNQAREGRGLPAVNGVWFWGGGSHAKPRAGFQAVLADDFAATALARAAGIPARPLPAAFAPASAGPGRILAVVDAGRPDPDANWFSPLLRALKAGRLTELHLEIIAGGDIVRLDRAAAWRLWRGRGWRP